MPLFKVLCVTITPHCPLISITCLVFDVLLPSQQSPGLLNSRVSRTLRKWSDAKTFNLLIQVIPYCSHTPLVRGSELSRLHQRLAQSGFLSSTPKQEVNCTWGREVARGSKEAGTTMHSATEKREREKDLVSGENDDAERIMSFWGKRSHDWIDVWRSKKCSSHC